MYLAVKRVLDIFFSLLAVIILLPIMLIVALIVFLGDFDTPFFFQDRLGRNGKMFKIMKFRTMKLSKNPNEDLYIQKDDVRITKVGGFLRNTSLDELPQLINILKGDMSFIGPRPPLPNFPCTYDGYSPEQKTRFLVKPGLSGLSQVKLRNSVPWSERIVLDIEYVKNISFLSDIKLFFMTIGVVIFSRNIYAENPEISRIGIYNEPVPEPEPEEAKIAE